MNIKYDAFGYYFNTIILLDLIFATCYVLNTKKNLPFWISRHYCNAKC